MNRNDERLRRASAAAPRLRRKALPLSLSLLGFTALLLPGAEAFAAGPPAGTLPTGNVITGGSGTVTVNGTTMTVSQASAQLALNWTTFDIASNASVIFNQPSANAIALNRIGIGSASPTASQIYGSLSSNGQVFLINPAGIVFGAGSQVNVGGLLASTLDMDPTSLAGGAQRFNLDRSAAPNGVVNHGTIQAATGGGVALVGGSVSNDGLIVANAGHIFMDGADHAVLDFDGNNLINVAVTGALSSGSGVAVSNAGTVQANDGIVVLQASATPGLFTQMVNNSGVIQANSISGAGGTVQLVGTGGDVVSSNAISANGIGGGQVQLTSDAGINTSGSIAATGGATGRIALSGNALALGGALDAGGGQLSLTSQGAITQGSGTLTAGTLTGSASGNVALNQSNQLQALGTFIAGGNFSLSNASTLAVGGLNAGSGNVTLATAAGADLNLNGNVSAMALSLASGGNITQSAGSLSAQSLSGQSTGSTTLGQANQIAQLGNFSANGFSLTNAAALSVNGPVNSTADATLTTTSGDLTLNGQVSANNVLTLRANAGAITQTGGTLSATTLSGSASGSATLTQASNQVILLGGFNANGFSFTNSGGLSVNGPVFSSGDVALTAASGNLTLVGLINGGNVSLKANTGAIRQTGGSVTAAHLSGSAAGSATLTRVTNQVGQLDGFSASGFSLTNSGALTVAGPVSGGSSVALTAASGNLGVAGTLTGSNVALNASNGAINFGTSLIVGALNAAANGGITQTGALSATGASTFNAGGAITLNNASNALGGTVNLTGTNISLINSGDLHLGSVANAINGGVSLFSWRGTLYLPAAPISTGTADLTLVSGGGLLATAGDLSGNNLLLAGSAGLTLGHQLSATSNLSLNSNSGAITQTAGGLSAATMTGDGVGAVTLTQASNRIGQLNTFLGNGLSLTNGAALTVNGPVTSRGGGDVALTTSGDLTLNGSITGATVALNANGGAINQLAGTLTATTLTGSSTGATTLTQANQVQQLGGFASNGFSLANGTALTVNGPLASTDSVTLTTTGGDLTLAGAVSGTDVTLNAHAGAIRQTGGSLTAMYLHGNAVGAATLNQAANQVGQLNDFTANGFSLTNGGALRVSGPVSSSGSVALTTASGDLTVAGAVNGSSVGLNAQAGAIHFGTGRIGGPLSATASGGIDQSGALSVTGASIFHAGGAIALTDAGNALGGPVDATGAGIAITNSGDLTIGALNNGANGAVSLIAANGTLRLPVAAIDTGTTDLVLTSGNGTFATAANLSGANVSLAGSGGVTVDHQVTAGNRLDIASSGGDLTLAGTLRGANVALHANAGAIRQTAGALTAASLSGNSSGATSLTQAGNQIAQLGAFSSGGDFALTNGVAIQQSAALQVQGATVLDAGASAIALTDSGNHLQGNVSLTGGNTQIVNAGALTFGSSRIGGSLDAIASGDIGQSGALNVTGASSFDAGGAIALNTTGNVLGGPVSVTGAGIALTNHGGLTIGALNNGGNGAVSLVSTNGALILPATAINTGASDLSLVAGGGALATAGDLSGANVSLTSAGGVVLGHQVSAANNLVIQSGGAITQTGGKLVANTLSGSSSGVTALNQGNQIQRLGGFSAAGFSLTNAQALTVGGPLQSGGAVALTTTGGDLSIDGAIGGTAVALNAAGAIGEGAGGSLTAASLSGRSGGATALDQSNRIGSLDGFSANGFSLVNGQALAVNGAVQGGSGVALTTSSGDLVLNAAMAGNQTVLNAAGGLVEGSGGSIVAANLSGGAGGSVTLMQGNQAGSLGGFRSGGDFSFANNAAIQQTGALVVGGASRFQTNGQAIVLNDAGNRLQGPVSFAGGDTQIVNAGALNFGASQIGGSLRATAQGAIGQNGALEVAGSSAFDAGNGAVALSDTGNRFGGAVSASGTGIAIASGGDLAIGAVSNGGQGAVNLYAGGSLRLPGAAIDAGAGDLSLTSAGGALATAGDLRGANVSLSGHDGIALAHNVSATTTLGLTSGGAIAQSAGTLAATILRGQSAGATSLNQANRIGSIGDFSANGFSLTNGQGLSIGGTLASRGDLALTTTSGGLSIDGAASGNHVVLEVAGAIGEGAGGTLAAAVLSGRAGGATVLGTRARPAANRIGTLGGFSSPAGFSLTNHQTLTLASVGGSAFSVDAGNSPLYLAVSKGDLLQSGTTPLYDGVGTFASSGRIGTASDPIYAIGSLPQLVEFIGIPPAYFYALDRQGDPQFVGGQLAVNVPTAGLTSRAQNGNNRLDSYIDASAIGASYRAFGIVPSGIRLPPDQQACDPDTADCQSD